MWLFKKKLISGALEDNRSQQEKLKDYRFEELATAPIVNWKEKPINEWKQYPVRNQNGAGSCVAHSKVLELGILNYLEEGEFVELSARDIYTRRANNGSGMIGQDANTIVIKNGATLEVLMPSDNKTEEQINNTEDRLPHKEVIGQIFKAKNWIALPFDIDAIASIIEQGKGVNLFFRFGNNEWNKKVPIISSNYLKYHHSVVGIDYTLYQGKKAIIIQDSWGSNNGYNGRRIITEEWFNPALNRISWASYFEDLSNWNLVQDIDKPDFKFEKDLYIGMRNNDVVHLQDRLKYEETFPKTQTSTGYFGGITRQAVKDYQCKENIVCTGDEYTTGWGRVGPQTRGVLNKGR